MPFFRLRFLPLLLVAAGLTLGNCKKDDVPQPQTQSISPAQLTKGSWRLDQITQGGQVTSSGAGIKDQYSLTFRTDGTYTQKLLADNTTYNGVWMLMNNSTMMHVIDHKGASAEYTLVTLTASEFRYSFTNKDGKVEERVFSAQP
ncbi:hypothetical protein GCM10027511_42650 [Hymenobacter humi]